MTNNAAALVHARFKQANLSAPPVPQTIQGMLRMRAEWFYTTRGDDAPRPYDLTWYGKELLSGNAPDPYLVIAHDGHGINSWALHYYLVRDHVALLLQVAWGNALDDADQKAYARRTIDALFALVQPLWDAVAQARSTGALADDDWLVVVGSDYDGSRWGRWRAGEETIAWQEAETPLTTLEDALFWLERAEAA